MTSEPFAGPLRDRIPVNDDQVTHPTWPEGPWVFDPGQLMDRQLEWVDLVSQEKFEPALREFTSRNGDERALEDKPITLEER